jgi:hypothetical protein
MGIVLQPNVSGRESYWDVGPRKMKIFPGENVRYASVIFLLLTLRPCTGSLEPPEIALIMLTIPIIPGLLESGASCFGGGGGGGWA